MACQGPDYSGYSIQEAERDERWLREEIQSLKTDLDTVTRLLCDICNRHPSVTFAMCLVSAEFKAWWQEHEKLDKQRQEREEREATRLALEKQMDDERRRLVASARSKLTEDERHALGLYTSP